MNEFENLSAHNKVILSDLQAQRKQLKEKDLIIQGLQEGAELWKQEYDDCRAILTELVYLKNLKDNAGKTEEYEQRQPLVWIKAKKFIEKYQHLD